MICEWLQAPATSKFAAEGQDFEIEFYLRTSQHWKDDIVGGATLIEKARVAPSHRSGRIIALEKWLVVVRCSSMCGGSAMRA